MKMNLKLHLRFCLLSFASLMCYGYPDLPYYYELPLYLDRMEDRDLVPFYDFDKPPQPFEKRSEPVYISDILTPTSSPNAGNWKEFIPKNEDTPYVTLVASPQTIYKRSLNRKRRSLTDTETILEDKLGGYQEGYDTEFLSPLMSTSHTKDNVRTIHLPRSFTPRLGRKRSGDSQNNPQKSDSFQMGGFNNESPRIINLSPGNAFTPRLGRSESTTRIHLNTGNAFTPRLGRSDEFDKIHLKVGSAFSPRLGRSESPNRIHLNVGTAFTPRLGRSEQKIQLNAGNSYTPRLGRSESSTRIQLNAGSGFTPRLGRSVNTDRISLNAGSSFTPRLG